MTSPPTPPHAGPPPGPITTDEVAIHADEFDTIVASVEAAVFGKTNVVRLALAAMLARGHVLLEDVPGVGKTTLARAISSCVDGKLGRIQFTPDLLPSDVTGVTVFNQATREFEFHPGPVFSNVVIADEINRASPKTQSALLEVMEEGHVTVDGTRHPIPSPFLVVATQNPVEMDGTYRLPEAQLDRFLVRLTLGYADHASEIGIIRGDRLTSPDDLRPRTSAAAMDRITAAARRVYVDEAILEYVVRLASASREHPALSVGLSTRSTVAMVDLMRVYALTSGRGFVTPEDVQSLALPAWAHRLVLSPEASVGGRTGAEIVTEILEVTPTPQPRVSETAGG